jgi:hypothetical protein
LFLSIQQRKGIMTMHLRNVAMGVGALLLTATTAGSAHADGPLPFIFINALGAVCHAGYGQSAQLAISERGASNVSETAPLQVYCPATSSETYGDMVGGWDVGGILYYNDNSSTSSYACHFYVVTAAQDQFWGPTRYACSEWGGCTEDDPSNVGRGMMWWPNPFPFPILSTAMGYACTLPPLETPESAPSTISTTETWEVRAW